MEGDDEPTLTFTHVPFELSCLQAKLDPKAAALSGDTVPLKQRFQQWDIADLCVRRLRYSGPFNADLPEPFVMQLLRSSEFQKGLGLNLGEVKSASWKKLSVQYTSLDLFDRLYSNEPPILRDNGRTVPRLDEIVKGYTVSDRLRECLLMEDSELWDVFPKADRNELLFHLFSFVALGGALNQFENTVDPYMEATRALYKELVSVARSKSTGKIEVTSSVFQLLGVDASGALFPKESVNNRLYVSVDAGKKQATVFYFAYKPYW